MILASLALMALAPLKWNVAIGDSWRFRLEESYIPMEQAQPEDEQRFVYEGSLRVVGVTPEEMQLERRSRLVKQRFGGEDLPPTKGGEDSIEKLAFLPNGQRAFAPERYSSVEEFRLSRLTWFGFPSSDEGSWRVTWPKVEGAWAPEAEVGYRVIGRTNRFGRNCRLIAMTFREATPQWVSEGSGRLEVDEASGVVMALHLAVSHGPLPGGTEPQRLTVRYEVLQATLKGQSGSK